MQQSKLNLIIKKTITPRASLSSLVMCVSSLAKQDIDAVYQFMTALCDRQIDKAALVTSRLSGELALRCRILVLKELTNHCRERSELTEQDLLAILEFDARNLFHEVVPSLSPALIRNTFAEASSKIACRFMAMTILYGSEEQQALCQREFSAFLNQYDSSADAALSDLIPLLFAHNAVAALSKLISTLGTHEMEKMYPQGWRAELTRLIVSGYESMEIWDAYFSVLFSEPLTPEQLLVDGLWFLQLHAEDESKVAACFYLYAAGKLDVDHPIFDHADCFDRQDEFTRKHTNLYQQALTPLWKTPERLSKFLDNTYLCNPFANQLFPENEYSILRNTHFNEYRDYNLLVQLFEFGLDAADIVKIFFNTWLKHNLAIEDLLFLGSRYEVLPNLLDVFAEFPFRGVITKFNQGLVVMAPRSYYVMALHIMRVQYDTMSHILGRKRDLKGKEVSYVIRNFQNGLVQVEPYTYSTKQTENPSPNGSWASGMETLRSHLSVPDRKLPETFCAKASLADFPVEHFVDQYDLGLLTQLICDFSDRLPEIMGLFHHAKWNAAFRTSDFQLPGQLYQSFGKYQDDAILMFKKLFSLGIPYKLILQLYFSSIYKVIAPFDRILEMADYQMMCDALSNITIYVKLRDSRNRNQCRILNVSCPPVCEIDDTNGQMDYAVVPAKCTGYTLVGGVVGKIFFQNQSTAVLGHRERGAVFGFIAINETIGPSKRNKIARLPETDSYDTREMLFALECMEKAILLRRSNGKVLLELLKIMGKRNPFGLYAHVRADISYLCKMCNEKKQPSITAAMISMILNASCAQDIARIYLNTSAKFYMHIGTLVSLVVQRRPDLSGQIDEMFAQFQLPCVVDDAGYLWSPLLPQNTVSVDRQHRGSSVLCTLTSDPYGHITAQVLSPADEDSTLSVVTRSLLTGYTSCDAILPVLSAAMAAKGILADPQDARFLDHEMLVSRLVQTVGSPDLDPRLKGESLMQMRATAQELVESLSREDFSKDAFRFQMREMIATHGNYVPLADMEETLAMLTDLLMQHIPEEAVIIPILKQVFSSYSYHYRNNNLVNIWINQLEQHLGHDVSSSFAAKIQKNPKYLKNIS